MKLHRVALLLTCCSLLHQPAWATSAAPTSAAGGSVVVQDGEEEIQDKRKELKEMLDKLSGHIKARGKEDTEAKEMIAELKKTEWQRSGPKDRKAILKVLDSAFKAKRKELEGGGFNNGLYVQAAEALGAMGPESVKVLMTWIDHKSHRKDKQTQRMLLLSLGKTKDEGKGVKLLMDQLLNREPVLVAAAAEALDEYSGSEGKLRKEIFGEVLKIYGTAQVNVDQDPNDLVARERYDKIEASMVTTLQALTGQELRKASDWQSWWNDNKRKNWDEDL